MGPVELAQAGPVAILLVGIALLYRAFVKGDVVVGSMYREQATLRQKAEDRAVKAEGRADKAETQAERNTEALVAVTAVVKQALDQRGSPGGHDALG